MRRRARAERRLPGDDPKVDWWDSPVRDLIEKEVRRFVPPDFATSLFARDGNHPAVRQIMKYRTEVRNADTSNPMTRTVDQTWLPRLEEALTRDRNARLAAIDTKTGGQALERAQNADRQYAALKEHHVAPLKPILGDNVRPEQAMDRLTRSMGGKDLTMIRAYTHAHRMARQEIEGAGAVVAHLMEGGVGNFVEKYATFNPAAKAELFSGQARSLGTALDRYARLAAPAVEAQSDMRFRPISGHSSALAISYVLHNITGVITTALGQYGAARFLASPRYVNWLTRASVATGRKSSAWDGQLQALLSMAGSDQSELGRDIIQWISQAGVSKARADSGQSGKSFSDRLKKRIENPAPLEMVRPKYFGDNEDPGPIISLDGSFRNRNRDNTWPERRGKADYSEIDLLLPGGAKANDFGRGDQQGTDASDWAQHINGSESGISQDQLDAAFDAVNPMLGELMKAGKLGSIQTDLMHIWQMNRSTEVKKAIETLARAHGVKPPWAQVPRRQWRGM
jgi:hypothetical protein